MTSPSTEGYDRGDKLDHYKRIPSLREVVIVSHAGRTIEVWRRVSGGDWDHRSHGADDVARLRSLDCELAVEAVYRDPLPS